MKFLNFLFRKSYKLALLVGNKGFYPEINAWFFATLTLLSLYKLHTFLLQKPYGFVAINIVCIFIKQWGLFHKLPLCVMLSNTPQRLV